MLCPLQPAGVCRNREKFDGRRPTLVGVCSDAAEIGQSSEESAPDLVESTPTLANIEPNSVPNCGRIRAAIGQIRAASGQH